jgi:hypothetical protein
VNLEVHRVEDNLARSVREANTDGLDPAEARRREVDVESEVVVLGNDRGEEPLRAAGRTGQDQQGAGQCDRQPRAHRAQCTGKPAT